MMFLLKGEHLSELKADVEANLEYYKKDGPWLQKYRGCYHEYLPENDTKPVELIINESSKDKNKYDLENTKRLYEALKQIPPSLASDEKFWTYLTHFVYWDYMRKRWPLEDAQGSEVNYIRTRYFFGEKSLVRNGLSRLWWYGYATYDETLENPYEYTELMLSNQDLTARVMESNNLVRNKKATKAMLGVLQKAKKTNGILVNREFIRELTRYINYIGAVTIWDMLSIDEAKELMWKWCKNKIKASALV